MQKIDIKQVRSTACEYDYEPISVYANVVELLKLEQSQSSDKAMLCLDFGCGYGVVADAIVELGYDYIGFDWSAESVSRICERGYEAYALDFTKPEEALTDVLAHLKGRKVNAVLLIDLIEHLPDGGEVLLSEIRKSISTTSDFSLIIAVPNITHRDIAARLASGMFAYTRSGLLDYTHLQLFSEDRLSAMCKRIGFVEVKRNDYLLSTSDQSFPIHHPLVSPHSSYSEYVASKRCLRDSNAITHEFVRLYHACASDNSVAAFQLNRYEKRLNEQPFLSVVTRTQGRRLHSLEDMMISLAGQSLQDFELILVFHNVDDLAAREVFSLINKFPEEFRNRVKTINCSYGGRAAPLNVGVKSIQGEYVAFLDDDDTVFGHWVEMFAKKALETPGRLLRSICVEQNIKEMRLPDSSQLTCIACGPINARYDNNYSLVRHLIQNRTPFMSMAFPACLFQDLKLRFDEELSTAEDWDFQMRVADFCGVAQIDAITAIYRRWQNSMSSKTAETSAQWEEDYKRILKKRDAQYYLLPPGSLEQIHLGLSLSIENPSISTLFKKLFKAALLRLHNAIHMRLLVKMAQQLPAPLYLRGRAIYRKLKIRMRKV
jgi:SAM-dependent methyltransferase